MSIKETKSFYSTVNVSGTVNIPKTLRDLLGLADGDSVELQIVNIWKKRGAKEQ